MSLKVCRICGDNKDLKNILEQGPEMIDKLIKCANVHIFVEDLLPKLICQQCDANLELSYRLRQQSDATQKRLRRELRIEQMIKERSKQETILRESEEHSSDVFRDEEHQSVPLSNATDRLESLQSNTVSETSDINDEEEFITIDNHVESRITSDGIIVEQQPIIADKTNNRMEPLNELLDKTNAMRQNVIEKIFIDDDEDDDDNDGDNDGDNDYEGNINTNNDVINETSQDEAVVEHLSIDLVTSSDYTSDERDEEDTTLQSRKRYSHSSLTCTTCQQQFTTKAEYSQHIKQHGTERFQCIQCCKFFPTRYRMGRHEETHMEVPLKQCPHCQRFYRSKYNLERHIRSTHTFPKKFNCEICYLSFSRGDALKRHMLLHSDNKDYVCTICSQSFKIKAYLHSHTKTHHPSQSSENDNFTTTTESIRDEKTNKYICGSCGKELQSSSSYKTHLLIHTNEKPHECETCKKKFRTIAAVMTHERIHSDYRPYQCDICLKSFRQSSHLNEHKILHLITAPKHTCSMCQAQFTKKGNLKAHMRTHTKDKPFQCAACTKTFTSMHLLKRHANLIHGRIVDDSDTTSENLNTSDNGNNVDITECSEESEQRDYIDSVAEDDFQKDDTDDVTVLEYNQDYPSSSKLKQTNTNTRYSVQPEKLEKENSLESIEDPFFTHTSAHIDTSNLVNSQSVESDYIGFDITEEEEIHITEQSVEAFVSEETKLTTFYNMDFFSSIKARVHCSI